MRFLTETIGWCWELTFSPKSSFGDRIIGTIGFGAILFLFFAALSLAHSTLLSSFVVNEVIREGKVVVSKKDTSKHDGMVLVPVGRVNIPLISNTPDSYSLCFDFGTRIACGDVNKEVYDIADVGKILRVSYGVSRLDRRSIVIKSIEK